MSIARNNRRMSSSLYGVAWTALLSLLLPFAVWADDEEGEIEEIVVTGSLIKRDSLLHWVVTWSIASNRGLRVSFNGS